MAIFKCKMCGGTLEIKNEESVVVCDYCGTKQTLPKNNDEAVSNLFNRANTLRLKSEFDKAEQIYEKILEIDNAEAEAHWGLVLCKYGIEYVEDPQTFTRVPTCHRASYDSILADESYLSAIANADMSQKVVYEDEAKKINDIQRNILDVVKNEKSFDVFICYKETDANGQRTVDSVIANDIYHQLTNEGFKVFYAAITLEDKLGQEYEPYIFSALNSSKVMLVVGTKPEYFEAVWVKNEWSRFLKLLKTDRSKLLIPCYRDMDAYDLPTEFSHLQSQDMSKIGFINDIERGIKKVIVKEQPKVDPVVMAPSATVTSANANIEALLKRAYLFLEDGAWESADEYCEKVLDLDPENARAYLGKTLVTFKLKRVEELAKSGKEYLTDRDYKKAIRFADDKLKAELEKYLNDYQENQYNLAVNIMGNAKNEGEYNAAAEAFKNLYGYKDSQELRAKCIEKAELIRIENQYEFAVGIMNRAKKAEEYKNAAERFGNILDYKDSRELQTKCNEEIVRLGNLDVRRQNLTLEISKKKNALANIKAKYQQIESQCNINKKTLDDLKNKKDGSKLLLVSMLGRLISIVLFFVIAFTYGGGEMSNSTALAVLFSMLGMFVFWVLFVFAWFKTSLKLLRRTPKDIVIKFCIILFVPLGAYVIGILDFKEATLLRKNAGVIENQIQECVNALGACQGEMTELEAEIQQLTMQVNALSE